MIKAIIFDLGGVVVDFTNKQYYTYLSRISGLPWKKVERIIESRRLESLEKGLTRLNSFEDYVTKMLKISKRELRWFDFYKEVGRINPDVEELVKILHKGYIIAFMTNVDFSRYTYTLKILDLDLFDYRFVSCYTHSRKPEPRIFLYALREMDLKKDEVLFIDNLLENVKGARKFGIKSIHFVNRRQLDIELGRLDL